MRHTRAIPLLARATQARLRAAQPVLGVAREGWPVLSLLLVAALILFKTGHWFTALPLTVLAGLAVAWFRERSDTPPASPDQVVSPVSGRVMSVRSDVRNPLGDPATRVRLRVQPFGSYGLRAPTDAMVREIAAGACDALPRGCSRLQNARGEDFLLVPRQGLLGKAPVVAVPYGQRIGQARRIGARRAMWTLDLYLPPSVRVSAHAGDAVRAGQGVIGSLS